MRHRAAEIQALSPLSGNFVLGSERQTRTHFDEYRFEAVPALLAELAKEMFR